MIFHYQLLIDFNCIASIISKKAAENISALVLDVKVGRAAFFKSLDSARQVAKSLVCNTHIILQNTGRDRLFIYDEIRWKRLGVKTSKQPPSCLRWTRP